MTTKNSSDGKTSKKRKEPSLASDLLACVNALKEKAFDGDRDAKQDLYTVSAMFSGLADNCRCLLRKAEITIKAEHLQDDIADFKALLEIVASGKSHRFNEEEIKDAEEGLKKAEKELAELLDVPSKKERIKHYQEEQESGQLNDAEMEESKANQAKAEKDLLDRKLPAPCTKEASCWQCSGFDDLFVKAESALKKQKT